MTKRIRTIAGFLMGLFMVLSIMAPSMANAATARPATGNLSIHKVQTNYYPFNDELIDNDGLTKDLPADSTFLEGAEFTIYSVSDDVTDPDDVDESSLTEYLSGFTGTDGILTFNDLPAGRYYVKETFTPKGVEEFSGPFLVDVPMMHPDGDSWNSDVHVYPKNQLILGAVELMKFGEDGIKGLDGATFSLYKEMGETDELIESGLVTDSDGNIFVGDLVVGSYYFVETAAPEGYGLNETPITFEVTKNDHAYGVGNNLGNLIDSKVIRENVELMNYDLPDIEKFVTTIDNKVETADFGEDILWIIRPEVPGDIATYDSFIVIDTFGPEMDYTNNLAVYADNTEITSYNDSYANGELRIEFTSLEDLAGVQELRIEFTTAFNDTAIMGMDYYNSVDLEFNNGYDDYDATEEDEPYAHTGGKPFMKEDNNNNPLNGAEFVIYNKAGLYLQSDYSWGDKSSAWVFISGDGEDTPDGYFEIKGLAYGDYYLEETKAPLVDGVQYRLLDNDKMFTVDASSYYTNPTVIESPDADPTAAPAIIENSPEITLPQTGGVGTLVFSIIGLGLMGSSIKLYKKSEK
ncbi:SpaA isopeptide-forming pilin-related protein [Alkalibacterium sp. MB6]|uniref:SpaA isopeptide-forming pilin-related protein n=1 Tax=Alkalibacterium sp. MB6 TaxID=2081965 RepID=UPI001379594C|nr:SpaA isopeptide-forming pilin-related protein [Alkalibacterium sp. MB6]